MVLGGNWVGRVNIKGADTSGLGRWSYMTLQGTGNQKLTVITAYQVPKTTVDRSGAKTAYIQQFSILRQEEGSKPDPRKQFFSDLTYFIRNLRTHGHGVVLVLDANAHPNDKDGQLAKFLDDTDLRDPHVYHHTTEAEPATYH